MSDQPCTIHDHSGPVREDFIDFPTGWRLQCEGLTHTDLRCSAVQTGGAMLCDCPALKAEWQRRVAAQRVVAYDRAVLVEVLVYHYRADITRCGCGWAELGKSHPEHVATVYEESVAARTAAQQRAEGAT